MSDRVWQVTFSGEPETVNGFTRTLYFYSRGPGDPPGNQWIWMCGTCDQVPERGHAPDCPWIRYEAQV